MLICKRNNSAKEVNDLLDRARVFGLHGIVPPIGKRDRPLPKAFLRMSLSKAPKLRPWPRLSYAKLDIWSFVKGIKHG